MPGRLILYLVISLLAGTLTTLGLTRYTSRPWYTQVWMGLFLCCLLLFLLPVEYQYSIKSRRSPRVIYLLDKSLSIPAVTINSIKSEIQAAQPRSEFRYFSRQFSARPGEVISSSTALWDMVYALASPEQRLIVISDFQDNESIMTQHYSPYCQPVVLTNLHQDFFGITGWDFPDRVMDSQPVPLSFNYFASRSETVQLTIRNETAVLHQTGITLREGSHTFTVSLTLKEGYHDISLTLEHTQDPYPDNNRIDFIVQALPSLYPVLLLAGRPGPESAWLNRYLQRLQWVQLDTRILSRPDETIHTGSLRLNKYDLLILMDVADRQLSGMEDLKDFRGRLMYLPGLRTSQEISRLVSIFELSAPQDSISSIFLQIQNQKKVVRSRYPGRQQLIQTGKRVIFLGWDTWKWDLMQSGQGIQEENYQRFWSDLLVSQLSHKEGVFFDLPLNYLHTQPGPRGIQAPGKYTLITNGVSIPYRIHLPYQETGRLHADTAAAQTLSSHIQFYHSEINWKDLSRRLIGASKIVHNLQGRLLSSRNWVLILIMLGSLCLYWYLSDRILLNS